MDFIQSLFSGEQGVVAQVVAIIVAFNGLLMGVKSVLDLIKDKTASSVDNKVAEWMGKIVGYLQKAIDVVSGNSAHKK